jgi:hypothetical protein
MHAVLVPAPLVRLLGVICCHSCPRQALPRPQAGGTWWCVSDVTRHRGPGAVVPRVTLRELRPVSGRQPPGKMAWARPAPSCDRCPLGIRRWHSLKTHICHTICLLAERCKRCDDMLAPHVAPWGLRHAHHGPRARAPGVHGLPPASAALLHSAGCNTAWLWLCTHGWV